MSSPVSTLSDLQEPPNICRKTARYVPFTLDITITFQFTCDNKSITITPQEVRTWFIPLYTHFKYLSDMLTFMDVIDYSSVEFKGDTARVKIRGNGAIMNWVDVTAWHTEGFQTWHDKAGNNLSYRTRDNRIYRYAIKSYEISEI